MSQADSTSLSAESQGRDSGHRKFRPDIEGLRAVAVVAVVLFHAAVPGIDGGFVGVDVFFVISGFLITGMLWREASATGTVRLRNFYGARARRLLPAAAAVGVVTLIGSTFLLPPLQARTAVGDGIASALYVSNYRFIMQGVDYFANYVPSPFEHYWSLGVEEQFYLVWPVLIIGTAWLIHRVRRRTRTEATSSRRPYLTVLAFIAALSFLVSFVVTYITPAIAFFSLPTRAWQLAIGGLVALTATQWRRLPAMPAAVMGWAGLALILLACVRLSPSTPYPGIAALLPTLGTALVIGAGCAIPSQGCGRVLGLSGMRAIGRISYSWYLWHWPVLIFAPLLVGHPLGLAERLTAVLVSVVLAVLTLRYLENPLRFSSPIRTSAWRSLAVGGAATAFAVCVGAALMLVVPSTAATGQPATPVTLTAAPVPAGSDIDAYDEAVRQTFAQAQAAVAASANINSVPSNLQPPLADVDAEQQVMLFDGCLRSLFQGGQPECTWGDRDSSTTVALVGDSHAAMWNPAFRQVAEQRRWRMEMLTKGACPLLDVSIPNPMRRFAERFQHCEHWRAEMLTRLRADPPQLVVLSMWRGYGVEESLTGYRSYGPEWLERLTDLVGQLRDGGSEVLVLGPIPSPGMSVPMCLSGHPDAATACTLSRSTSVDEAGIAAETAATEAGGGRYIDLTDLFCTADRCPVVVGNTLVYLDMTHVTLQYSRLLAPVMGALADRALAHR